MNSLLIIASVIALAVAGPAHRGLVTPGGAGPAPVPEYESIAVGPAILDFEPIAVGPAVIDNSPISVGPAIIDFEPIAVGPAIVEEGPISVGPAVIDDAIVPSPVIIAEEAENVPAATPLVQIILNINGVTHVIDAPISPVESPVAAPEIVEVEPVQIVDAAPEPVQIVDAAPEPVQVVEVAPIEIGAPALPEIMPEPVVIVNPILPSPVVLPETLN